MPSEDNKSGPTWDTSGFTKPNGRFERNDGGLTTFVPDALPPALPYDDEFITLLMRAERKMAELKGRASMLRNPQALISAYVKREAVSSSRIEGTSASLDDLNTYESGGHIGRGEAESLRIGEVLNYVAAFNDALGRSGGGGGVDLGTLKGMHSVLMGGVAGGDTNPGEFRTEQNVIGGGTGTGWAITHVPPPPGMIAGLLGDLEGFLRADRGHASALIRCAMIHYQFEAIHPFLDGNGRVGRMLVLLMLCKSGMLPRPLLCLSDYFYRHRGEYYGGLSAVSRRGEWDGWVKFFLRAFIEQADEAMGTIELLEGIRTKYEGRLGGSGRGRNAVRLMEGLFSNYQVTIPRAARHLGVAYPAAKNAVRLLANAGILELAGWSGKPKIFVAREIADVLGDAPQGRAFTKTLY